MAAAPTRLGALSEQPFRWLWLAHTASAAGTGLIAVALAFAVLDLTGSAADLGIVLAASTISRVAFILVGGVGADRLPRRSVMNPRRSNRAGSSRRTR